MSKDARQHCIKPELEPVDTDSLDSIHKARGVYKVRFNDRKLSSDNHFCFSVTKNMKTMTGLLKCLSQ